jgi:predicted ATPase/GAF domain-containing protein
MDKTLSSLPGYQVKTLLYESPDSLIYRGQRLRDNLPVILKTLKQPYPSPEKVAWFKQEYELTLTLKLPGVIEAYSLETIQGYWVMVLEDFGGESLDRLCWAGQIMLADFLSLAIKVTDILDQVHRQQLMHKDINPANLVLNPKTGQVKLIDFGLATPLSRENPTFRNPEILEGTLPYLSPEQTGRMNRAMDYRTDFYSLGITFYELLSGQLPFPGHDPLELVHSHIAKPPVPLHEIKLEIPETLSLLILKLMAKNAEDRYQSAHALKLDLEECLWLWQSTRQIRSFPLGRQDVSSHFQLSQKLYGRESETEILLLALERVSSSRGTSEVMLISGYAGIGKTALVREIYRPLTHRRGYFISGKYDQFQKNIPYTALIQAFRNLIRQILTESEARIAGWREALLAALGANGQLLIEVIPEIKLIIGSQPEVTPLGPGEAQNRFNLMFQRFIQVFAQPEHPLVIFLDDLQWADGASLKLIELLMTARESRSLFLIGSYRDNEVGEAHPLQLTLARIRGAGTPIQHIVLSALDLNHITKLVADSLRRRPESANSLATLILAKTGGNPFFINQFLKSLYAEKFLSFNFQRGSWQWDLEQIQNRGITDNVVMFMVERIQQLNPEAQEILKLIACIGNQFDLETIAVVTGKTRGKAAMDLWEAIAEGLVLPLSDTYRLMTLRALDLAVEIKVEYRFAHDRIQQAAYLLMTEAERQQIHHRVGWLLLQNTSPGKRAERIFDIVNQLNMSLVLITTPAERDELAELNLIAGGRAKASAAYEAAFRYLQTGLSLLGEDAWSRLYPLALALHTEAAEAAYLSGDFAEMERLAEIVLQQAKSLLDKVKIYEIKIQAHIAQHQLLEAVQTALPVLELLGLKFPRQPGKWRTVPAILQTRLNLMGKQVEALANLPEMTDPYPLATLRILSTVHTAAYFAVPELVPLEICARVNLSVKYGNTDASAFAYADYGLLLCGLLGKIEQGYEFGQLALALLKRRGAKEFKAKTLLVVNSHIRHWREHARETLSALLEAYQAGLETGDLEFAAIAAGTYAYTAFYTGESLAELQQQMVGYHQVLSQFKQTTLLYYHGISHQLVLNLLKRAETPDDLKGEVYNEEEMLSLHLRENDRTGLYLFYYAKMVLSYLFGDGAQTVEWAVKAEDYLDGVVGLLLVPTFHFYDSLARLAIYPYITRSEQRLYLRKVAVNQSKLKTWAEHAPMNYLHEVYLVEAEQARVLGQPETAIKYYLQAIDLTQKHKYVNKEALAHEALAKFYLAQGQEQEARHHLVEARYSYSRWGATAKVDHLDKTYPYLQSLAAPPETSVEMMSQGALPVTTQRRSSDTLDMASISKALHLGPGETSRTLLLENLIRIAVENSGAQRGLFLLAEEEGLKVEMEGTTGANQVVVSSPATSLKADDDLFLPLSIINYVVRTGESIILHEAVQAEQFNHDSYIITRQPKSVLCVPVRYQRRLQGLVYLENNLTTGVFTPARLKLLHLLASQAASALAQATPDQKPSPSVPAPTAPVNGSLPEAVLIPETGATLTSRELEVLSLMAQGATNRTIAEKLVIAMPTVKSHITHILTKLNVASRAEAVSRARNLGIIQASQNVKRNERLTENLTFYALRFTSYPLVPKPHTLCPPESHTPGRCDSRANSIY